MGALTLVVTGASGFVGRAVVASARARGHTVRALVRRADAAAPEWDAQVRLAVADLAGSTPLGDTLDGADAVIHLAAAMRGDATAQHRDTVDATDALCRAIRACARPPHLVLVSSMSVYAHDAVPPEGLLDETAPREARPERRDLYCRNKILQEDVATGHAGAGGAGLTILRPGAVYGPGHLWNAHLGVPLAGRLVAFSRRGAVPSVYVKTCADAIVRAAETRPKDVVNLIDCPPPDRAAYLAAMGWDRPVTVVPWRVLATLGRLFGPVPRPGLLRPEILRARMMPVRYDTARMQRLMDGVPMTGFAEAMRAARKETP
ncbi:MAG: NAD(P)-dependent oxidoreductase [Rhodobacteraceae bacterium]|nr:NAD(P)-dependent oxidoreductase [Paracoccaceae bacterium]